MLDSVLTYINNHLEETITLDELAKVTGYSPYYLHRKLKAELQEPIGSFIQKQRVQAATYLLTFTELPVAQVRLLVGYANDSAFSRVFKSITGVSPRTFPAAACYWSKGINSWSVPFFKGRGSAAPRNECNCVSVRG